MASIRGSDIVSVCKSIQANKLPFSIMTPVPLVAQIGLSKTSTKHLSSTYENHPIFNKPRVDALKAVPNYLHVPKWVAV